MSYCFGDLNERFVKLCEIAIAEVERLKIPCSQSVYFRYNDGRTRFGSCGFGQCGKYIGYDYVISVNKHLVKDDDIVSTVIHEFLHTIKHEGYEPMHGKTFRKWMQYVNENSVYNISITDDKKLDYIPKPKPPITTRPVYCPCCGDSFDCDVRKIRSDGVAYYYCVKCKKSYLSFIPTSPFEGLDEQQQTKIVDNIVLTKQPFDVIKYISFTNSENTYKLIKHYLLNIANDNDLYPMKQFLSASFKDVRIRRWLMCDILNGVFNNKSDHVLIAISGFLALTKEYLPVSEYLHNEHNL